VERAGPEGAGLGLSLSKMTSRGEVARMRARTEAMWHRAPARRRPQPHLPDPNLQELDNSTPKLEVKLYFLTSISLKPIHYLIT
jgi:hypothetical protein